MDSEIQKYINKRYDRWLDYSEYHCEKAGLKGEAGDVLNVVLLSLIQKDENSLLELFRRKKGQYSELDFYVLRMLKFNCVSDTAPYRAKNKPMPVDANVDPFKLDLIDEQSVSPDLPGEYLEKYQTVCRIAERLDLDKTEKEVFQHAFILGEPIADMIEYSKMKKELYNYYKAIKMAISIILFRQGVIKNTPTQTAPRRTKSMIDNYYLTKIY